MRKSVFRDLRLTDSFTARNRVGCTCLSLHCYLNTMLSRVHLAFHARIQGFRQGGPGQSDKKRGGTTFSRGGGSNCLYPIETHITCEFPGGPDPLTPLWIRTCYLDQQEIAFFHLVVFGWYFSVLFKFR